MAEVYGFIALRYYTANSSPFIRNGFQIAYVVFFFVLLFSFLSFKSLLADDKYRIFRLIMTGVFFVSFASKLMVSIFMLLDDILRFGKWLVSFVVPKTNTVQAVTQTVSEGITRNEFLVNTALGSGVLLAGTLSFGIISGAHDYRVRKRTITLPNLPKSFDGITMVQLSDIHSGSFYNKVAVTGGIEMALAQKPDLIVFTGDLVNDRADEMKGWADVFAKLKAPLGVYSTLGNHDYGDYTSWPNEQAKIQNLKDLMAVHKHMGWDLLMNENRIFTESGDKIALVGVENFGAKGQFIRKGRLDLAVKNTDEASAKILLSHDPSHWDFEVNKKYKDVDLMLSGHTHGMQFGIEIGDFRWSPVSMMYEQWADLHKKENQYLYVNRGFGFIGFPGRVGILPEITVLTLKSA